LDRPTSIQLRIGDWRVNPTYGQISRGAEVVRLEARTLRLLLCLAQRAGEVVSIDDLLDEVWSGVVVTPDSVYQAVASLRRLLGDDARQPAYIATVPRLGYRMVATVSPWVDEAIAPSAPSPAVPDAAPAVPVTDAQTSAGASGGDGASHKATATHGASAPGGGATTRNASAPRRTPTLLLAVAALCLTLVVAFQFRDKFASNHDIGSPASAPPPKSVAVLPFLDLTTQEMNEEFFADGMTEELIDKLSKIPGLRVPPPTSSFYFKGKRIKLADIARSLGVAYLLDGSVRKSDATLRIAARLIRANDGYVIWTETYDRPVDNKLSVQDDIASEVAKALTATIN
jgi:transcriptional activator of cad operon